MLGQTFDTILAVGLGILAAVLLLGKGEKVYDVFFL